MALGNKEAPVELQIEGGATVVVIQRRPAADRRRCRREAHARGLRLGGRSASSRRSGPATSTRWSSSTTTSPACSPSTRPASSSTWRRRASDARPQVDAGPLLPGRESGRGLGRHRHRRSALDRRRLGTGAWRAARPAPADGLDDRRRLRSGSCSTTRSCRAPADMPPEVTSRRRAHRRELRAVALLGALRRRCRRQRCAPASPRTRCAHALHQGQLLVNVTCGGAPVYVWPGGGITVMVDVMRRCRR